MLSFHFFPLMMMMIALVKLMPADGFSLPQTSPTKLGQRHSTFLGAVKVKECTREAVVTSINDDALERPFLPSFGCETLETSKQGDTKDSSSSLVANALVASGFLSALTIFSDNANAIQMPKELTLSSGSFDPSSFVPVCGASDNFYRFLQGSAKTIVGPENFQEYGPLIASGLLRVRLELCVVESFFNEAVGPFIQENGLSWVLPLHETVETFLAGTVFALATTFILVGSTKILTVIFTYADFFIGFPLRSFGGFAFDRARGKPVTLDIGIGPFKTRVVGPKDVDANSEDDWTVDLSETGPAELAVIIVSGGAKAAGAAIKLLRDVLDAIDLFVGKSLVLWVTAYIGFKFIHFKIFPDFPPF